MSPFETIGAALGAAGQFTHLLDLPKLTLRPEAFQLRVLIWPLLFGIGAYLFVTAQPIGKPKPDLAKRLRRLDVDERIREELGQLGQRDARPVFASRTLELLVRPALDDAGRLLQTWLARFGLARLAGPASGREMEHKLRLARPAVEPAQFFGEKLACGVIGLALPLLMNGLGIHPFGPWPLWASAAGFPVGFLAPDWDLERRLAARRTAVLMELAPLLDMLAIAASAGLALEQALELVVRQANGLVAQELRLVTRELALGQRTLGEALEALAERNDVPELTALVSQLRAAHEQGLPLGQTLAAQADSVREHQRLRILEAGGKASVKMLLPVAVFILPVLFVVLLVPAMVEVLRLGAG